MTPYCLETLAAAYAEVGDFAEATKRQKRAAESYEPGSQAHRDAMERLKLFEQRKPYRE
jgi:hypothetical protein